MPSFDMYKKITNKSYLTPGQVRKNNSDQIMEYTWNEDIASKEVYIFDYYHDEEPLKYYDIHPEKWKNKTKVDIKFIVNSYNSENKDIVGKHIMFKPSFRWQKVNSLSYYKGFFIDKYEAEFPIGLYLAIPDEKGIYRKWLVTEIANSLDLQFPTWYILPIDHIFQWIHNGYKYQMCGVSRSQSSYNSGEWVNYKLTVTENQRKCILPMNNISATIFYNTRIILSAPIETPVAWHVSKVEQTAPKGVSRITFAQEQWDEHKDVFEYEDGEITSTYYSNKKVIGMWADYKSSSVEPVPPTPIPPSQSIYSTITYSGTKPEIKSGGSYKKFTVNFYQPDGFESNFQSGHWDFTIDNENAEELGLVTVLDSNNSTDVLENQVKIKFNRNDMYIGKVLNVAYISDFGIISSVDINIVGL